MEIITGSIFTYEKSEDSKIVVTAFSERLKRQIKLCVKTTDFGVAAVDAFLYFERLYKEKVKLQQLEYLCAEYSESVDVSILSNELLNNFLTNDNKELVACFISLCDIDSCEQIQDLATAENILLQNEILWNTVCGEPVFDYSYNKETGALLTIEMIRKRYSHIWNNYLFTEKTNMFYDELMEFYKLSKTDDENILLYWTFIMCFWGQAECRHPYTLYCRIKNNSFKNQYETLPKLKTLLIRS